MAKIKLLVAGLYATSAFASPWFRNKKRGESWGDQEHTGPDRWDDKSPGEQPWGYGTTESAQTSPWGYGSTSTCEVVTVTETQQSVVTETKPANTVSLLGYNNTETSVETLPAGPPQTVIVTTGITSEFTTTLTITEAPSTITSFETRTLPASTSVITTNIVSEYTTTVTSFRAALPLSPLEATCVTAASCTPFTTKCTETSIVTLPGSTAPPPTCPSCPSETPGGPIPAFQNTTATPKTIYTTIVFSAPAATRTEYATTTVSITSILTQATCETSSASSPWVYGGSTPPATNTDWPATASTGWRA